VATPRSTLVTARVVADRLGVSTHRVYELVRTGQLPSVRLGRSVRIDPVALEGFIAGGGTTYDADTATS
jgi:excisionase family DNA binding protein